MNGDRSKKTPGESLADAEAFIGSRLGGPRPTLLWERKAKRDAERAALIAEEADYLLSGRAF